MRVRLNSSGASEAGYFCPIDFQAGKELDSECKDIFKDQARKIEESRRGEGSRGINEEGEGIQSGCSQGSLELLHLNATNRVFCVLFVLKRDEGKLRRG
jgi:hypothetical protein